MEDNVPKDKINVDTEVIVDVKSEDKVIVEVVDDIVYNSSNDEVVEDKVLQDIVNTSRESGLDSFNNEFSIGIDPQTVFTVNRKED